MYYDGIKTLHMDLAADVGSPSAASCSFQTLTMKEEGYSCITMLYHWDNDKSMPFNLLSQPDVWHCLSKNQG